MVTVEPANQSGTVSAKSVEKSASTGGKVVFSTFAGTVDVADILVKVGDTITEGHVVAQVEAMKAKHDIRSPHAGVVADIHVAIGDEIDSTKPILTLE